MSIIDDLRPRLEDYLRLNGVEVEDNGKFCCIIPGHEDSNPSATIVPGTDGERWRCFVDDIGGDIFAAAHYLHDMPQDGSEFMNTTVRHVCETLGVEYREPDVTPAKARTTNHLRLYAAVAEYISTHGDTTYGVSRGWSHEWCQYMGCASVEYQELVEYLKRHGFSDTSIATAEIAPEMFSANRFTFTLRNAHGRPVAFAARALDDSKPKYINSSSHTGTWQKAGFLYNLSMAKKHKEVIVVEGYADVMTMVTRGVPNVVASCGTSFGREHANLLRHHDVEDIVIAMDWDNPNVSGMNPGHEASVRALKVLMNTPGLKARLWDLGQYQDRFQDQIDTDQKFSIDPDTFFTLPDATEIIAERPWTDGFEWSVHEAVAKLGPEKAALQSIEIILAESFLPRRFDMLRTVARITGYDYDILREQCDRQDYQRTRAYMQKEDQVKNRLMKGLRTHTNVKELLSTTLEELEDEATDLKEKPNATAQSEVISFVNEFQEKIFSGEADQWGFTTGYDNLDRSMNGFPETGKLIVAAGNPNAGKSTFMANLYWRVLRNNWERGAAITLFSTDDDRRDVILRFISIETGIARNRLLIPRSLDSTEQDQVAQAWNDLRFFVEHGFLKVKDQTNGTGLGFAKDLLMESRMEHPDRSHIFVVDSFHKLFTSSEDLSEIEHISGVMQSIARQHLATVVLVMEVRKTERARNPNYQDLKGSGKMAYDADWVGMVWNELHDKFGSTKHVWLKETSDGGLEKQPIVRVPVQKSKLSAFKPMLEFKFDTHSGQFIEHTSSNPEDIVTRDGRPPNEVPTSSETPQIGTSYLSTGHGSIPSLRRSTAIPIPPTEVHEDLPVAPDDPQLYAEDHGEGDP